MTSETLTPPLTEAWTYRSTFRPMPAWQGPARRDGWHKTENLKPRMVFDWAFHVVAADGAVYFGSSADDKLYCLDGRTGEVRWTFFAGGAIRFAPTIADGKMYVGADDGVVYCLSAADGKPIWQRRSAPQDQRVASNGRMVSIWPVRSGVVVDGGVAYFCSGLFAFEGAYLCAVDAKDGREIWTRKTTTVCPQGYLLASATRLYLPAGGGNPAVFNRRNGRYQYALDGSGGAFAVLSSEALIYGPGKTGTLEAFGATSQDHLATFAGNTIVVTPRMSYLHSDTELSALDRTRYLGLAAERNKHTRRIDSTKKILAKLVKEVDYDPPNFFAIGTLKDNDENYVFKGRIGEVRVWNVARDAAAIQADMNRSLADKPAGLVGYWQIDEGPGEKLADSAGKSHGKFVGAPKWVTCDPDGPRPPSGRALEFDGTTSYVDAGKNPALRVKRDVTVEAWIRAGEREKWSGIAGNVWDSGKTEAGYGLSLDHATGVYFGLKAGVQDMVYLSSGPDTIALNRWYHVAGTYDGKTVAVYVDGELKASKVLFPPLVNTPEELKARIKSLQAKIATINKEMPTCIGWKRPCKYPYSLILAGEVLYAGGTGEVGAFGVADGKTLWTASVDGRALDLAVADGRLLVSTDKGVIHCFAKP